MTVSGRTVVGFALLAVVWVTDAVAVSVWNNPSGGLYSNAANWTGGVPAPSGAVSYNVNGTYTVNVDVAANHGATQFNATNANVALNITGPGYTIPATVKIGGASGTNSVSVSGTTFDPTTVEIAPSAGAGTLSLSGPLHATGIAVGGQLSGSGIQADQTSGGLGTLNLNAGADATINTLLADNAGSGSKINFNAGILTLMGQGRLSNQVFTKVGDGTQSATLNVLDGLSPGNYWIWDDLTISNNATLNLNSPGGSFSVGNLILDKSGSTPGVLNWTAGNLQLSNTGVDIAPSGLFGSSLELSPPRALSLSKSTSSVTVASGSSITISGGVLSTPKLNVNPGGTVTYLSGEVWVTDGGDLEIGPNGITNTGGITLNNYDDILSPYEGDLSIAAGQSLTLNGGFVGPKTISNSGTFTFNTGRIQMDGPLVIGPTGQLNGSPNLNIVGNSGINARGDVTIQPTQTVTVNGGGLVANHIINNGTLIYNSGSVATYRGDLTIGPTGQVRMQSAPNSNANFQALDGTITFQEGLTVGFNGAYLSAKRFVIEGDVTLISTGTIGGSSVTIASSNGTAKLTLGQHGLSNISTNVLTRGNLVVNSGTVSAQTMAPPTNYPHNTSATINKGEVYGWTTLIGGMAGYVDTLTMNGGSLYTTNFQAKNGAASQIVFNGGTILMSQAEVDGSSPFTIGNGTTTAKLILWGNPTSTQSFADGVVVSVSGQLVGDGTLTGNVTNHGYLSPGQGGGTLTINGTLTNRKSLVLDIYSETYKDKLTINGSFDAGGTIFISGNGFQPANGTVLDLVDFSTFIDSGAILDLSTAILPLGSRWDISQFPIDGTVRVVAGLTADFNQDGTVDAADYSALRKGLRARYTYDDFATWRDQFGLSAGSGTGLDQLASVPEPSPVALLLIGTVTIGSRRRRVAMAA